MKNNCFLILSAISLVCLFSCAEKIYLLDAHKQENNAFLNAEDTLSFESYYAGDAFSYIVFELDAFNNTDDSIRLSANNVFLEVMETGRRPNTLNALAKDRVISDLQRQHEQLQREKKARDIANVVSIGINVLLIGATSNYGGVDAAVYAADGAIYMMEDSRAHKLISGSLEDQIAYVDEWVLGSATLAPGSDSSWDILFPRHLVEAPAVLKVKLPNQEFTQNFQLKIREEKLK